MNNDGLISRKAFGAKLCNIDIPKGMTDVQFYAVMLGVMDAMINTPSVPAAPLDKLCEWLAKKGIGIPCETCRYFENNYCMAIEWNKDNPCPNTTDDWREAIKKWMEGLE